MLLIRRTLTWRSDVRYLAAICGLHNSVTVTAGGSPLLRSRSGQPGVTAADQPEGYDVMVVDANMRQGVACIRSLGRLGLRVVAVETFAEGDERDPVLGFRSRFTARRLVLANYSVDSAGFAAAVKEFLTQHPTQMLLPTTDGSVAALLPHRQQLEALGCRLALPASRSLHIANSKPMTLTIAENIGVAVPPHMALQSLDDVAQIGLSIGYPAVIKPVQSWAAKDGGGVRICSCAVIDVVEARRAYEAIRVTGLTAIAQPHLPGRREAVTLFVADGQVKASFAHVEYRTSPVLGGASVLRESIAMPSDLYDSAVRVVDALQLDGLSSVEFRRDAAGVPALMEVNARVSGMVETSCRSGVDFPSMLWSWVGGADVAPVTSYRIGVRSRWLRGELRWLLENRRDGSRPDSVSSGRAVLRVLLEFLRGTHIDCFSLTDPGPAFAELRTAVAAFVRALRERYDVPASPADPDVIPDLQPSPQ